MHHGSVFHAVNYIISIHLFVAIQWVLPLVRISESSDSRKTLGTAAEIFFVKQTNLDLTWKS